MASSAPASNATTSGDGGPTVLSNGIFKSANDDREYRYVELPNKIRAMLVQDASCDKASAAMCVKVGHFSDPDDVPGLAHFCEHMLFLGTKKYPEENSYNTFLNQNGGYSNAFTASEETNYFFEVQHEKLEEAFDRFAQFFIAPLFTDTATARELQAVNSENDKNLQNDMWRELQLARSSASPSHAYHKFGTGNLTTLRDTPASNGKDVRDELLKFHEEYYSANQMCVCIVGRESLDTLESWVRERFSEVRNTDRAAPSHPGIPYTKKEVGKLVRIVPVKDVRKLQFVFPMHGVQHLYATHPTAYISHLIGHEGPGSLLSLLKAKNWATALWSSPLESQSSFTMFFIEIKLTEAGLAATEEVIAATMQYTRMIREAGPQKWVWDEHKATSDMSFRFKSKEAPSTYAHTVAGYMHLYPKEETLTGYTMVRKYDPDVIRNVLDKLDVENMVVRIIAKAFEGSTDKKEQWYGTDYSEAAFTGDQIKAWSTSPIDKALRMPPPNEFLATDFSIKFDASLAAVASTAAAADAGSGAGAGAAAATTTSTAAAAAGAGAGAGAGAAAAGAAAAGSILGLPMLPVVKPELLRDDPLARLWYKAGTEFQLPKSTFVARIYATGCHLSPRARALTTMYQRVVTDSLNEFAYSAELAELAYSLSSTSYGFDLEVSGFSHKLPVLLSKVTERMASLTFSDEMFERLREAAEKQYTNIRLAQPYQHSIFNQEYLLSPDLFHRDEQLEELKVLKPDDLRAFFPQVFSQIYIESLVYGNETPESATELLQAVLTPFTSVLGAKALAASQHPAPRCVRLPTEVEFVHSMVAANAADPNSAIEMYFQVGRKDPLLNALLNVTVTLLREPAFTQLRTKEQLGYIVFTAAKSQHAVDGARVIIQSSAAPPDVLDERIEAFLANFGAELKGTPADVFAATVRSVAADLLETPKKIEDVAQRLWAQIRAQRYTWDSRQQCASFLPKLTLEDVVTFFDTYFSRTGAGRRKLSTHVLSPAAAAAAAAAAAPPAASDGDGDDDGAAEAAEAAKAKAEAVDASQVVVGGVTSTGTLNGGVTIAAAGEKAKTLSLDEGIELLNTLSSDATEFARARGAATLDAVKTRLGLAPALRPVVVADSISTFRDNLSLYPAVGHRSLAHRTSSKL